MQRIHLAMSGLALAVGSLVACSDSSSGPSAPSEAVTGLQPASPVTPAIASIRLRCERRSNRSKISVDGRGLVPSGGRFRARVTAAGGTVTSPLQRAVGDEAEFDFDSNRNDIREGATRISATFIRARSGPDVVARILNASGRVVATRGAECESR
jgi:hypothetical protein